MLASVSQHVYQRSIGVEQLSLWRAEVDSFLQSFEQFGETSFLLSFFGDVASQGTYAHHLVALYDGVQHAIKEE